MKLPVLARRLLLIPWDVASLSLAFLLFVLVRFDGSVATAQWASGFLYTGSAIALQISWGLGSQIYLGRSRVGSFTEATALGASVAVISLPAEGWKTSRHPDCLSCQ